MSNSILYHIFPLGDSALTVDFGNTIDESINKEVHVLFTALTKKPLPGMLEAVPLYSSLTIYYDMLTLRKLVQPGQSVFEWMEQQVIFFLEQEKNNHEELSRVVNIPVCYDPALGIDLESLAIFKGLTNDEVIKIHSAKIYRVFMLGFLPGFSYMGEVDDSIAMARKSQPVQVAAGSVGIAGKQTGIYPMGSPGGWQIIGRTPLQLFDKEKAAPTLLMPGDKVQFYSISRDEFENY